MTRVGVFVGAIGRQASGPETYERSLLRALASIDQETEYRVFCFHQAAADAFGIRQANFQFHILRPQARWLSLPISLPLALSRARVDLCHATFVPPPLLSAPLVMTLHGSDMFAHPEFFRATVRWRLTALLRRGFRQARLILCVSRHVRDYVQERFHIPDDKLMVVYHGIDPAFHPSSIDAARELVAAKFGVREPYALYVGKLISSKNIERLVEAFQGYRRATSSRAQLVLVGKTYERMGQLGESFWRRARDNGVILTGHLSHHELPPLFRAATLFVFPSLWEGFGLPVLEAMASGTPVITSNNSCLPEITAGAAELIDPYSVAELQDVMTRLFQDEKHRSELSARGLRRAADFSWGACAQQTREAYRRIAAAGHKSSRLV